MMMKPARYRIRVQGYLAQDWQEWFRGLAISHPEEGVTALSGLLIDQAALHGILTQLYGLGFPLLSVHEVLADDQRLPSPSEKDGGRREK